MDEQERAQKRAQKLAQLLAERYDPEVRWFDRMRVTCSTCGSRKMRLELCPTCAVRSALTGQWVRRYLER